MKAMWNWLRIQFSILVFSLKCRAGMRQLGWVSVRGTVRYVEVAEDGDTCFGILPDKPFEYALGYVTPANGGTGTIHDCGELHCEIVPADRERLSADIARLAPGVHVRVNGERAWDGCHHARGVLFDALMVLLGAAPTVDGWLEIHPVAEIEILE